MEPCQNCGASVPAASVLCPTCGETVLRKSKQRILEGDDAPGPELELDLKSKDSIPPSATGLEDWWAERSKGAVGSAVPVREAEVKPLVDPLEARLLGKFGRAPDHWWETPKYARDVKARLVELEESAAGKRASAERAAEALGDALVALAKRAATAAQQLSRAARAPYLNTLERLKTVEAEVRSTEGAQAAETGAQAEKLRAIEERIAEFSIEHDLAREEQRKAGESASPELKKRVEEARAKLAIVREERDVLAVKLSGSVARSPAAEKVRNEYRDVCSRFALHVVDDTTNFGTEFNDGRRDISRLTEVAEAARKDLALHEAALVTYDQEAVNRGKLVVRGAIGLAAFFLIVLIFLVAC